MLRVTLVTLAALLAACTKNAGPAEEATMQSQARYDNRKVVRTVYERCLGEGRLELLEELVSPDFVGASGERGPAGFEEILSGLRTGFPDIRFTLEDLIAEGDRVTVRWTWTGTHTGQFRQFAPSQKRLRTSGIAIYQLRDGRIVRAWLETDRLGFLQQIGAAPPTSALVSRPEAR